MRWFARGLAALLILVIGAVFAVLEWPTLLLNDRTLSLARDYLHKHGAQGLDWKKGELDAVSLSLFKKRIRLKLEEVCYEAPDVVQVCFDSLEAQADFDLSNLSPKLSRIGPVRGEGGRFALLSIPVTGAVGIEGPESAKPENFRLGYEIRGSGSLRPARLGEPSRRVSAKISGELGLSLLQGTLTATVDHLAAELAETRVHDCHFEVARKEKGEWKGQVTLDCPVEASVPSGPWGALGTPKVAGAVVTAELLSRSFPPSLKEDASGIVEAKLNEVKTPLFKLAGNISTRISGRPEELGKKTRFVADLAMNLEVPRFGRVAERLESTPWALWAPVRNLKGSLSLEATGKFDPGGGRVPFRLETRLRSRSQKLDIESTGELELGDNARPRASLEVLLHEVELELPRLDLAAPPRLLPDSRMVPLRQRAGRTPEKKTAFAYDVHVKTPPGVTVKVLSNLAQAPVPLGLDLHLKNDQPLTGNLRVEGFPVKFFNRKATIEHFNLSLRTPQSESPIDGEVRMDLTDYQFRVLATGTVGKPGFTFESDPPLTQDQILAALLYGAPPDQLDSEQSSTVSNTSAALSDQAVGLASFFLLGSTPIQGLSYDPSTRQMTVRFRIAEGTSLSVGGTGEAKDIGVRRRLGKDWSIATDLITEPGEPSVVSAFLEWAHRY